MKSFFSLFCLLFQACLINADSLENHAHYPQHFPNSCMDLLRRGEHTNGYYQIAGTKGATWNVFCDFTSELGSAWTLVMSWSLKNAQFPAFKRKSLTQNAPVNERTPNWMVYRMSKEQMDFLKTKSSHWRATCSFIKYEVDYIDYVRGNFIDFDITSFLGGQKCKKVEYINVRGHGGHETATFWQGENSHILHTDSSIQGEGCHFNGKAGAKGSEDNFGYYNVVNPTFRCTSSPSATTQYWFGGYL